LALSGPRSNAIFVGGLALWLAGVGYGLDILWRYSTTPGHPASPPLHWPSHVSIEPPNGRPTIVMFAHPQCGCSRASLGELAIIMARARDRVAAYVFFYVPADRPKTWAHTDLWDDANAIPGVHTAEDQQNFMAEAFGAFTSGQILLYDFDGRLVFNGGITASRGHSGDSYGRDAILALIAATPRGQAKLPIKAPVFGCSLRTEEGL
jgi:hypothetical protein